MSYLLPFESYQIITDLKPDEVSLRLKNSIRPYRPIIAQWGGKLDKTHLFEGIVDGANFNFRGDNYHSRNKDLVVPMITGKIFPSNTGSIIHIKIKPARKILMPYVIGVIFAMGMALSDAPWGFFILIAISIFSYPFIMIMFKYEVSGVRSALRNLLDGKIQK